MRILSLFVVITVSLIGQAQLSHQHASHGDVLLKSLSTSISNCEDNAIPNTGIIEANYHASAILYEFKLQNLTTNNSLLLSSTTNSISLSAFWSIITYNSNYKVSVRFKYIEDGHDAYTEWSSPCQFALSSRPKNFGIEGIACESIVSLDYPIYCTQLYIATCYTFYVTNLTTSQSTNTGCITNNYFTLSSLGIAINPGDVISIYVSYTIGEDEKGVSRACRYTVESERPFCHVIQEDQEAYPELNASRTLNGTVGSHFEYYFQTNADNAYYAPALWDGDILLIEQVIQEVLADLDDLLIPNTTTSDCGNTNQRMRITFLPYPQTWVDDGLFTGALGVASQVFSSQFDINYLGDGCVSVPNIQLYNTHGAYGDPSLITIGNVYLNPAVSNFNYAYSSTSFTGYYDLYTVLLHEITHILGISSSDYIFKDKLFANTQPLNAPGFFDCAYHPNFATLSTQTCTYPTFFDGSIGDYPIYSPTTFDPGSSLSHFPDVCGTSGPYANVMHPSLPAGVYKRCYEQNEINALQDLGFNFNTSMNYCSYTVNNTPYVIGNHDGISVQADPDEGYLCDDHVYIPLSTCSQTNYVIRPLSNDINADYIAEAVVKTGNANATVTIISGGTELNFYANIPGMYTIGYIPGNSTTGRLGLPTYIQVWVPVCGAGDLDAVTCHDGANCNQLCFNDIREQTLLRGTSQTQPTGFASGTNGFSFGCHISESDQTSGYIDSYSSVFFFADIDNGTDYSVAFDRSYQIIGPPTYPDPDARMYIYLVKSADMIGLANQSHNNFASLPTDNQLIYEDAFDNGNEPFAPVSFCFTADDEYDMMLFYCKHINNQHYAKRGKTTINNLEFMEKEFVEDVMTVNECTPYELSLGLPFCATQKNDFEWLEVGTNTVVSTTQFYNPGVISTPLSDSYTFTMSYPPLPSTTLFPASNSACAESYTVDVDILECCTPGNSITHPLTATASSRTFGEDVDADANGALYYTGEFVIDVQFGTTTQVATGTYPSGFIAKFYDDCVEWIVETAYRSSRLQVADAGRIFYSATDVASNPGDQYFAEIDPANGSPIWEWTTHITGSNTPYITDFKLDETASELILVGQCSGTFLYDAVPIAVTASDAFVLRLDYNGNYLDHAILSGSASVGDARVGLDGTNIVVGHKNSTTQWTFTKFDYSTLTALGSPTPRVISSSSTFKMPAVDIEGSNLVAQVVFDANVMDVTGSSTLLTASGTETGYIKFNGSLAPSYSNNLGSVHNYFLRDQDMDIYSGDIYLSYIDGTNFDLHVSSYDLVSNTLNWDQITSPASLINDWIGNQAVKGTPLGIYNTGAFYYTANIIGTSYTLTANLYPTTFYGIKYDNAGNVVAMVIPDTDVVDYVGVDGGNKSAQSAGVSENLNGTESPIKLYPNPTTGQFTIMAEGYFTIQVQDLNGKVITALSGTDKMDLDLSTVSSGVYLVKVQSETATQFVKLVKE